MGVEGEHARRRGGGRGDGRACHAGAAPEVDHQTRLQLRRDLAQDGLGEQKVEGAVVEGERRTFAGAVERSMFCKSRRSPLDIGRREGPYGACDLAEREVRKVSLLKRRQPRMELGVGDGYRTRDLLSHSQAFCH